MSRVNTLAVTEQAKLQAWPRATACVPALVVRNVPLRRTAAEIAELCIFRAGFLRAQGWAAETMVAVHAGGVAPEFGVAQEMAAIELLSHPAKLVLMGPDRFGVPLKPGVVSLGWVPADDWIRWLACATLGLAVWTPPLLRGVDSLQQWNTPLSWCRLGWYLSAGLPIVAAGHRNLKEFIAETGAGIFVDDVRPESLAAAMEHVLVNRDTLGRRALLAFERSLNFDTQAAELVSRLVAQNRLALLQGHSEGQSCG